MPQDMEGRRARLAFPIAAPRRRLWFLVGALVASVAAAACSSGSGSVDKTATAFTSVQLTAATGAPTPGPSATPTDPSSLTYKQDTGPKSEYRIDIPDGWTHEDTATGRRYVLTDDAGRRIVSVAVGCTIGRSIDDMMTEDNEAVGRRGGRWGIGGAAPVTIGGLAGRMVDYVTGGATSIEGRTIYFVSARCGWRLTLSAYQAGGREAYASLFDRVARSFQELPASNPG